MIALLAAAVDDFGLREWLLTGGLSAALAAAFMVGGRLRAIETDLQWLKKGFEKLESKLDALILSKAQSGD